MHADVATLVSCGAPASEGNEKEGFRSHHAKVAKATKTKAKQKALNDKEDINLMLATTTDVAADLMFKRRDDLRRNSVIVFPEDPQIVKSEKIEKRKKRYRK